MKFTVKWLKEHLETDSTLQQITDRLTMIGLEVETVSDRKDDLKGFVVGHVTKVMPHPNADRLRLCDVDIGSNTFQVVCGAPNVRPQMKAVFAPIGTHIPGGGFSLKAREIRGVMGEGMLCSEQELGLGDNHSGILELDETLNPGEPFVVAAGLDDPVIEIAITPNRGDCLGVHGIARDLAASGLGKVITSGAVGPTAQKESAIGIESRLDHETRDACPYLVGRLVEGVINGPSPVWLKRRLSAIGLRPISMVVDVTNFVTFDRCRPLHAFDADKVVGDIHVRLAADGEEIETLDDRTHRLTTNMTVICDDLGPIAIAGVIGGVRTSCANDTTNIFLESALFDPIRTARTGRELNVESDARYRFERGIDPEGLVPGIELATRLMIESGGGEASRLVTVGGLPDSGIPIYFRSDKVGNLGGLAVPEDECRLILRKLGFKCSNGSGGFEVCRPSWRHDINGEADLVEEVLRIKGYDEIVPVSLNRNGLPRPALSSSQRRIRTARRILAARSLNECVMWSFVNAKEAKMFGGGKPELRLSNPITEDLSDLRPSLLPGLLRAAQRNVAKGHPDLGFFEIGPQFLGDGEEGQKTVAGVIRCGSIIGRHWLSGAREADVFDVKADCMGLLRSVGVSPEKLLVSVGAPSWYHPGRSGQIKLGAKIILGYFGELHPEVLSCFGIEEPVVGAELFISDLPISRARQVRTRPMVNSQSLPSVERDFAFLVEKDLQVGEVLRAIRSLSGKDSTKSVFSEVSLFDVYSGDGVDVGTKSVALGVTIAPQFDTLTEKDIRRIASSIIEKVEKVTGGKLRQ